MGRVHAGAGRTLKKRYELQHSLLNDPSFLEGLEEIHISNVMHDVYLP